MRITVLVALAVLVLGPLGAEAGGRFKGGAGVRRDFHGTKARSHTDFHGLSAHDRSRFHGHVPKRSGPAPFVGRQHVHPGHGHGDRRHGVSGFPGHRHHHGHKVLVVPAPIFVTPSRCWTPGYWSYQWVPQTYTYNTWVPGQWAPDGSWVPGHYAGRPYNTGSYHPYWVEGYWRDC